MLISFGTSRICSDLFLQNNFKLFEEIHHLRTRLKVSEVTVYPQHHYTCCLKRRKKQNKNTALNSMQINSSIYADTTIYKQISIIMSRNFG